MPFNSPRGNLDLNLSSNFFERFSVKNHFFNGILDSSLEVIGILGQ